MTTIAQEGERRVYLIRHGEKNPSTAAVDPNQLTENGRRDALAYGSRLRATPTLEVYCSTDAEGRPVDRSHDTAWYIHAGYAGLDYVAANELFGSDSAERQQFVPGLEARLQQRVPDRILREYKAGSITRAQAMEQCYRMVLGQTGSADEQHLMGIGASTYLGAVVHYFLPSTSSSQGIILVGHDPNLGALKQLLSQELIAELKPLEGITFDDTLLRSLCDTNSVFQQFLLERLVHKR